MTREDFLADLDAAAADQDAHTATLIVRAIEEIESLEDLLLRAIAVLVEVNGTEEFLASLNREQLQHHFDLQDGLMLGSSSDE